MLIAFILIIDSLSKSSFIADNIKLNVILLGILAILTDQILFSFF